MRFSTIIATAAFITPAVLAASGKGAHHRGAHQDDHGIKVGDIDAAQGLLKVKGIGLGHLRARDDKLFAEELPGYTNGKNDGTMEPSPDPDAKAQSKSFTPAGPQEDDQPSKTEQDDNDMLDPSAMPSTNNGEEASFPPSRGYIRSRALNTRQNDDDEYNEDDDDARYACADVECGEGGDDEEDKEDQNDNAKYLAKVKRAREEHMKSQHAKRGGAGHKLKQASRREVVERSRHGRRTGSKPSASPRPGRYAGFLLHRLIITQADISA